MTPPYLTDHRSRFDGRAAVALVSLAVALAGAPAALAATPRTGTGTGGSGLTGAPSGGSGGSGGGSGLTGSPPGHSGKGGSSGSGTTRSGTTTTHAKPGEVVINGGGDGHGVGMSQYGAEGFALHGASATTILAHYYQGTALGHTNPNQSVRVLLGTGRRASFSGATRVGAVRLQPASTYAVIASGLGLRVVTAAGRTVASATGALTVTGAGPLTTGGRRYRGALRFSASPTGGIQTVDVVGLDDYVRGVVAEEMDASWAPAALEAQAIAARTYALTTSVDGNGYSLYDDTRSQMYGGASAETATTNAAVAATSGEIVTYDGQPVTTYYFASSGGETESVQNVWEGATPEPWLVGVSDPYDGAAGDPYHRWTVTMSVAAATAKLRSLVRGRLERIVVTQHGVSPRIITARVIGTRGATTVTGAELQQAFGLLSTDVRFSVGSR